MKSRSIFGLLALFFFSATSVEAQLADETDSFSGVGVHIDASIGPRINLGVLRDLDKNSCDFSANLIVTYNHLALSLGATRTIGSLRKDLTDDGLRMFEGESYKITTFDMKFGLLKNIDSRIYIMPMVGWNVGSLRYQGEMEYIDGEWEEVVPCDVEDFCIVARPALMASFEFGRMYKVMDDVPYFSWGIKAQLRQVRLHPDERNYDNFSYSISLVLRFGGSVTAD